MTPFYFYRSPLVATQPRRRKGRRRRALAFSLGAIAALVLGSALWSSMRSEAPERSPGAVDAGPSRFDLTFARGIAGQRTLSQWCQHIPGMIGRHDTLATAIERQGVDREQIADLITALRGLFDFRDCKQGEQFELLRSPSGQIERFTYKKSPLLTYRVEREGGKLVGKQELKPADRQTKIIALRIQDSLYGAFEKAGVSPALVMKVVDVFAWDIDFYIDTQQGDEIRLVVEELTGSGELIGYGEILAAEYKGQIGTHRAFPYQTDDDQLGYFDELGNSRRKAFLKTPLKFSRISSGFGWRVHPILGFSGAHNGIDLAAPVGTPIWSPGDGLVTFAGYRGANGNLVTIRHANGYETFYAHLQTIASGVRAGARIRQKQTVGTVGSTGRSTGPHLHYAMTRRGVYVNPFAQKFPPDRPVPASQREAFQQAIAPLLEQMDGVTIPEDAFAAFGNLKG